MRRSERWKKFSESSLSKFTEAIRRSISRPETKYAPSSASTVNGSLSKSLSSASSSSEKGSAGGH